VYGEFRTISRLLGFFFFWLTLAVLNGRKRDKMSREKREVAERDGKFTEVCEVVHHGKSYSF
jgi:hypothetical protein